MARHFRYIFFSPEKRPHFVCSPCHGPYVGFDVCVQEEKEIEKSLEKLRLSHWRFRKFFCLLDQYKNSTTKIEASHCLYIAFIEKEVK